MKTNSDLAQFIASGAVAVSGRVDLNIEEHNACYDGAAIVSRNPDHMRLVFVYFADDDGPEDGRWLIDRSDAGVGSSDVRVMTMESLRAAIDWMVGP